MIRTILGFILLPALLLGSTVVYDVSYALDKKADTQFQDGLEEAGGSGSEPVSKTIQDVINILLYVAGATAVLMIVIGGFRYVTSNGEPAAASKAKNTIIYALIGIVVAAMAYSIVNFILFNI